VKRCISSAMVAAESASCSSRILVQTTEFDPLTKAAVSTYRALWSRELVVYKWTFSTNGVASMGLMGAPTIGYGPGEGCRRRSPHRLGTVAREGQGVSWLVFSLLRRTSVARRTGQGRRRRLRYSSGS
jgi:hypothetical protein